MTIRLGMEMIVAQLRKFGQASHTDEFNGQVYWTDEQLQELADIRSELMTVKLVVVPSSLRTRYILKGHPRHYWFETNTYSILPISDGSPLPVTTASVYDPVRSQVSFAEPLAHHREYVIEGQATNLYLALADLWDQKAAQRYDYADFKAGNNKVSLSQEYEHCRQQAAYYRNRIAHRFER